MLLWEELFAKAKSATALARLEVQCHGSAKALLATYSFTVFAFFQSVNVQSYDLNLAIGQIVGAPAQYS